MQETWVRNLDWENQLEKDTATHSSILALENSMDRRARQAVRGVPKIKLKTSLSLGFLGGSLKIPPAIQETRVPSLGWEDSL